MVLWLGLLIEIELASAIENAIKMACIGISHCNGMFAFLLYDNWKHLSYKNVICMFILETSYIVW